MAALKFNGEIAYTTPPRADVGVGLFLGNSEALDCLNHANLPPWVLFGARSGDNPHAIAGTNSGNISNGVPWEITLPYAQEIDNDLHSHPVQGDQWGEGTCEDLSDAILAGLLAAVLIPS
jgi:hypothetical protein